MRPHRRPTSVGLVGPLMRDCVERAHLEQKVRRIVRHLQRVHQVPRSPRPSWNRRCPPPLSREATDLLVAGMLVTLMGVLLWVLRDHQL